MKQLNFTDLELSVLIGVLGKFNNAEVKELMQDEYFVKEKHVKEFIELQEKFGVGLEYKIFSQIVDIYEEK